MILAPSVMYEVTIAFKPLGAFSAVITTKGRELLGVLQGFVFVEMAGGIDIGANLIIVAGELESLAERNFKYMERYHPWQIDLPSATLVLDTSERAHSVVERVGK